MIILRYYKKNNQSAAVAGPRLLFLLIIAVLFSGVQGQSTLSQSGSDAFSTSSESNDDTGGDSTSLAASAAAALKEILNSENPQADGNKAKSMIQEESNLTPFIKSASNIRGAIGSIRKISSISGLLGGSGGVENLVAVHEEEPVSTVPSIFSYSGDIKVCEEVVLEVGLVLNESQPKQSTRSASTHHHVNTFYCNIPEILGRLELQNLSPDFEDEWRAARKLGTTRLLIGGAAVYRDYLILPNAENGISHRWQSTPSSFSTNTRKLAVNQFGERVILAFRITVIHNSVTKVPNNTAVEVSNAIFSTGNGDVSLVSQYADCSYHKLNFTAATVVSGSTALGVIDITVTPANMTYFGIQAAVDEKATSTSGGGLNLDFEDYDHIIYHVPQGVIYNDNTDWLAFADAPGKKSTYNNERITDVQTLMHEIAHNLDLYHSSDPDDSQDTEYGDSTGVMGYSVDGLNGNNAKQCFNGAKSYELGWYTSPNRVVTIQPSNMNNEVYQYKLIGVADYGNSTSDHTLILEIEGPNGSLSKSLFLTYNKAKGINADTSEAGDAVTVISAREKEVSTLIAKIAENGSHTITDYYNGRDLQISVGSAGQDGDVDYVHVTVQLETVHCLIGSDCNTDLNDCNSGTCVIGTCTYSVIPNCCGDGYCDASEHCTNCPVDCSLKKDCDEVDGLDDQTIGGSHSPSAFGIMFDIEALSDVGFYEIEADLVSPTDATAVKIYTKTGTYNGSTQWQLVFDGPSSSNNFHKIAMTFSSPVFSAAGDKRAFYITYPSGSVFLYKATGVIVSNDEVQIGLASVRGNTAGNTNGSEFVDSKSFLGGLKYTFESNLDPIPDGEPGSAYFAAITNNETSSVNFNEYSTLILSSSTNGDVMAMSGVIGDDDDTYGQIFKICSFKRNPTTKIFEPLGDPILNDVNLASDYRDDARADISMSGDGKRLAVSVVYEVKRTIINSHNSTGFVKVYSHTLENVSENWQQLKTVYEGDAGMGGAEIGLKVSLDALGIKVVIGEMYYDATDDYTHNVGRVMVYNVDTGVQLGSNITGTARKDYAGSSVAIARDGECFIYGAVGATGDVDSGVAYVYCWDQNDWVKRDSLFGEAVADEYGHTVAITSDGNYVAVGAHSNDVNGEKKDAGHVRVYWYNGTAYEQLGPDIDGGRGESDVDSYYVGDAFGFDVALSDLNQDGRIRIAIGAPNNQDTGYYEGQVCFYEWKIDFSTQWVKLGDIYGASELAGLGSSVTMDSTGNNVYVATRGAESAAITQYEQTEVSAAPSSRPSSSPSDVPSISSVPSNSPSDVPSISSVPSNSLSDVPSDVPSISSVPSNSPTHDYDTEFQIRTTYDRFSYSDSTNWCATPDGLANDSKIKMRPCKSYNSTETNIQVWSRTNNGQIKLSRPLDNYCLKKSSKVLRLQQCSPDKEFIFTLSDNDNTLKIDISTKTFLVGFDVDRKYSQLRMYKLDTINPSLELWETKYGPVFD